MSSRHLMDVRTTNCSMEKEICSFIMPQGLFPYNVLSFVLVSASATFQRRVVNHVTHGLAGTAAYIDDLVVAMNTWEKHLQHLRLLFTHLSQAGQSLNVAKSWFTRSTVT
ncbi:hypothetical protein O3P69_003343 [Scylla paramamosain]|uniref:Reverse transcriptase domain-containing protein n=1 Tax=Scylla paramamosain TaxID=85552 RepID=A0AAW0UKC4_SCYPA